MYIQIRTADSSQSKRVEVSKLTSVKELKVLVEKVFNVKPDRQRLFFRGKQLEDDYKVLDYSINLNDVVMLMIKPVLLKPDLSAFKFGGDSKPEQGSEHQDTKADINGTDSSLEESLSRKDDVKSNYFKVGDVVDAMYTLYGAWFEGKIVDIEMAGQSFLSSTDCILKNGCNNDGLKYKVSFDGFPVIPPSELTLECLRPCTREPLKLSDIKIGGLVLVNYNIQSPNERGFWYDMSVTSLPQDHSSELVGTIYVGRERLELRDCKILFTDEIFKILKPEQFKERSHEVLTTSIKEDSGVPGKKAALCSTCHDNPKQRCKECGCHVCGGKDDPKRQIMCDECNMAFHLQCLKPPLKTLPDEDEWYCPLCKNDENEIVKAGEKLKESKKKRKMASASANKSNKDWGKGMACQGKTKDCTIVPPNHFGPVPGVEVGMCWKFRLNASESGVHRPHVAGIHGRDSEGAFSIVLSGGYEDDVDYGEEFYYTGSGGRDLSGNKRTSGQSKDQTLTRMNLALARNCNVQINKEEGAEANDWKGGKPVRVLRNYKLAKHSKYAPTEGNRYDGIYKVVKYYPQKGESGFMVWRYLLRRDDPTPAPWTEAGKEHIQNLGLTMIYPEGHEDLVTFNGEGSSNSPGSNKSKKRSRESILNEAAADNPNKKPKMTAYTLDEETSGKISQDEANEKLWTFCKNALQEGKMKFLSEVQQQFMCVCCQELVCDPVTTSCQHNICKACLKRSFSADVFSCPSCRQELGKTFVLTTNQNLSSALLHLFPGYEVGR